MITKRPRRKAVSTGIKRQKPGAELQTTTVQTLSFKKKMAYTGWSAPFAGFTTIGWKTRMFLRGYQFVSDLPSGESDQPFTKEFAETL